MAKRKMNKEKKKDEMSNIEEELEKFMNERFKVWMVVTFDDESIRFEKSNELMNFRFISNVKPFLRPVYLNKILESLVNPHMQR